MIEQFQQLFDEKGFQQPTQIQTAVAETLASGKSVLGIAPTGSGKTLAFAWPLLPKVEPGAGVQILILEPSQELETLMIIMRMESFILETMSLYKTFTINKAEP